MNDDHKSMGGLILTKPDIRLYSDHRSFGSVSSYPKNGLGRTPPVVYDQLNSEFCTGYSMAGALSFKLGFPVSAEYIVAKEGEVNGSPILHGTDMDTAPKAVTAFGAIVLKDSPYSLKVDGADKIAHWNNWPQELDIKARENAQGAYYTAHDGPYDAFDNIISTIYKAHQEGEEIAVQMGTPWYAEFNSAALEGRPMPVPKIKVSDHAWVIFDWKGDTAYGLLSNGMGYGNLGVLEFPREVINFLFTHPYATTRVMKDKDLKDGSYKGILLQYLLEFSYKLLFLLKQAQKA